MDTTEELPGCLSVSVVEQLYVAYLKDAASVTPEWKRYFQNIPANGFGGQEARLGPSFQPRSAFNSGPALQAPPAGATSTTPASLQFRADQMIRNYRVRGHIIAAVDPLGVPRPVPAELDPAFYGFTQDELDRQVSFGPQGRGLLSLGQLIQKLRNTYCRSIGAQFMHIDDLAIRQWLEARMEGCENRVALLRRDQFRILRRLIDAAVFEEFLQRKFVGAKSFSLEGAESLLPLLDLALEKAGDMTIDSVVLGMAHRGRLNVLANIIGKSPRQIFREFEKDYLPLESAGGDVRYHLGYSSDWPTHSKCRVHLSLCFNPSHLEFVNPVALGRMRAKQDRRGERPRGSRSLVILIHGDAAFAGEGLVQETLNLSQLPGFTVGGTLHIILNNQLGFTTPPAEGRSTIYCSDVARMLQIPIFHVNGEDPEAVAQVTWLALEFRQQFARDVMIDMFCYRRRGHSEGDEPAFTQPRVYEIIERRPSVRENYRDHLLALGEITRQEADQLAQHRTAHLEEELSLAREAKAGPTGQTLGGVWQAYHGGPASPADSIATAMDRIHLVDLLDSLHRLPPGFHLHPKLKPWLSRRQEMAGGRRPLDWAAAEALALASVAVQGHPVRLSGQDSQRGTFSQRHAVLHDVEDDHPYVPLQHLADGQGPVEIINSPLSEAGVLGFEYGYSLDCPQGLVLWEAQFGDFCNAAQVIIDQFIVSAEEKWQRLSGLVLLLPHGLEGQGPEHSSARLERFLRLGAQDNIQVAVPSTPAQYFHLLRRQVLRHWRKPLIVLTPKSLLRHPQAVSSLAELAEGRFQRVIADRGGNESGVRRILLCSGKIRYELEHERDARSLRDIALVSVEELYPFPRRELEEALAPYGAGTPALWVQEEPLNMGAWLHLRQELGDQAFGRWPLRVVSRPASASPATGWVKRHHLEQAQLLKEALGG